MTDSQLVDESRMTEEERIEAGLEEIRGRRALRLLFFVGGVPYGLLTHWILNAGIFWYAWGFYLLSFFVINVFASIARCPKCSKVYQWAGAFSNPWTQKCMNCGLPLRKG